MVFQRVLVTCMHRQGKGELAPVDHEIEQIISRLRKERRVLEAHNMIENL